MCLQGEMTFFFPRSGVVALIGYGIKGNKVNGDLCVFFLLFLGCNFLCLYQIRLGWWDVFLRAIGLLQVPWPKTKTGRKGETYVYIYLEREQQEDVFTKSFKWIGQGKVLFFRAFYGVFRLMFMVSMGEWRGRNSWALC